MYINTHLTDCSPVSMFLAVYDGSMCLSAPTQKFCLTNYLPICMCICMYVCMYVCMCMMDQCVSQLPRESFLLNKLPAHMYVFIYVCIHACMFACMYVCDGSMCLSAPTRKFCLTNYLPILCIYICMYVCMHVCMHVCMCMMDQCVS